MPKKRENVYHRKDGLWEARYVKEIDVYGKKKYGSVYAHSCGEAKKKRQAILDHMLLHGGYASIRTISVSELTQEWLMINKCRLKTSSYQKYVRLCENHIVPIIGNMNVLYLTTANLQAFATNRLDAGLSPNTVNGLLVFLNTCLKYAHRQYSLPLIDMIFLPIQRKEMRVLSKTERIMLINYLLKNSDIYKIGVLLALYTGIRLGELCALRWSDIEDDKIRIKQTMIRLKKESGEGTELRAETPKTATSVRTIPIPSFLVNVLESFKGKANKDLYFLSTRERAIVDPRTMQNKFKTYLKAAGVADANFHALRHTFATMAVEEEFDLRSLSDILGHTSVKTTMDLYVHSSAEQKKKNMERLKLPEFMSL